jgi:hypothetical protein
MRSRDCCAIAQKVPAGDEEFSGIFEFVCERRKFRETLVPSQPFGMVARFLIDAPGPPRRCVGPRSLTMTSAEADRATRERTIQVRPGHIDGFIEVAQAATLRGFQPLWETGAE